MEKLYIQPGETRPWDLDIGVPVYATISALTVAAYLQNDNSKTSDLAVADVGISGRKARLVCHTMTAGQVYVVTITADLQAGGDIVKSYLVECRAEQSWFHLIDPSSSQAYWFDFADDLPTGIALVAASTVHNVYDESDATQTDLADTMVASQYTESSDDQVLRVDYINATLWTNYVASISGVSETDTITGLAYTIKKVGLLKCIER